MLLVNAQTSATIEVSTPGTFAVQLITAGYTPSQVTNLIVTGNLNDADIQFMNSNLTTLMNLNLKETSLANNAFPSNAFSNKTTLVSVSIPKNIVGTTVSDINTPYGIFGGCTKLSSVDLSGCINLKTIGDGWFSSCSSLTFLDLTVCTGLETIQGSAFSYCKRLKNITLPASLLSINGFDGCDSLQTVDITRCVALKTIAYCTFIGDSRLQNIDFTSCISLIGINGRAFERTSIKKMDLSKCTSLTYLDDVFNGCKSLQEVILPPTIVSLNSSAFSSCTGLQKLTVMRNIPPTLQGNSTFNSVSKSTCKLVVPTGSKMAYMLAAQWGSFANIEEQDFPNVPTLYNMQVIFDANGSVNTGQTQYISGNYIQIVKDSTLTFTIKPNNNYTIASILFNNIDVTSQVKESNGTFTFTSPSIIATSTLSVTFKKTQYQLSIKSAESGSVNLLCEYGTTPTFNFTASIGWKVNTILYNGSDVTSSLVSGVYIVPSISANALLTVSFELTNALNVSSYNIVKVYSSQDEIIVEGTSQGDAIGIYTIGGVQIQILKSQGERLAIKSEQGAVYLVRTAFKTFKVVL